MSAAIHRTRPILLTAAAATLGMIPIAPTVFWGPMAFAIIGGLTVATVLTLIFLPALYVAWFRVSEPCSPTLCAGRTGFESVMSTLAVSAILSTLGDIFLGALLRREAPSDRARPRRGAARAKTRCDNRRLGLVLLHQRAR